MCERRRLVCVRGGGECVWEEEGSVCERRRGVCVRGGGECV